MMKLIDELREAIGRYAEAHKWTRMAGWGDKDEADAEEDAAKLALDSLLSQLESELQRAEAAEAEVARLAIRVCGTCAWANTCRWMGDLDGDMDHKSCTSWEHGWEDKEHEAKLIDAAIADAQKEGK